MLLGSSLDLVLGEPSNRWHPVCWLGKAVDLADWAAPGRERGGCTQRLSGMAVALLFPTATYMLTRKILRTLPRPLADVAEAALISSAVATRSLFEHAGKVQDGLQLSVEDGRREVGKMVGRDTDSLDEEGVIRATVESVAENANDGVIAPLFYGLIGGAPLAMAYKMVNTLDSMLGYRSEQYLFFGWISARLDDAAGYFPARLTALSAVVLSPLAGTSAQGAISVWRRDSGLHDSPNAGVCESAYAGALGVCLGGASTYDGKQIERPLIGAGLRSPEAADIDRAARLMIASAGLVLALGTLLRMNIAVLKFFLGRRRD
ncbi:MAG: adenosylcobinamide-phosphate synthase CbiB [Actinobacteria bacterium]|nr:adenosylcobinamide-phosphate synthase CbiB [Actinomycetota bacterium]